MKKDVYDLLERGRAVPLMEFITHMGVIKKSEKENDVVLYEPNSKKEFIYNSKRRSIKLDEQDKEIRTIYDYSKYILDMPLPKLFDFLHSQYPLPAEGFPLEDWPYHSALIDEIDPRPIEELREIDHPALKYIDYELMKNFITPAWVLVNQEDDYEGFYHKSDTDTQYVHLVPAKWEPDGEDWDCPTGKYSTTTLDRGSNILNIFSGMDEYLAFEMLQPKSARCRQDALLIPDSRLFEGARPFMEKHSLVQFHAPHNNDIIRQSLAYAQWLDPNLYKDMGHLYKNATSVREKLHKREEKAMQKSRRNKPSRDLPF